MCSVEAGNKSFPVWSGLGCSSTATWTQVPETVLLQHIKPVGILGLGAGKGCLAAGQVAERRWWSRSSLGCSHLHWDVLVGLGGLQA